MPIWLLLDATLALIIGCGSFCTLCRRCVSFAFELLRNIKFGVAQPSASDKGRMFDGDAACSLIVFPVSSLLLFVGVHVPSGSTCLCAMDGVDATLFATGIDCSSCCVECAG